MWLTKKLMVSFIRWTSRGPFPLPPPFDCHRVPLCIPLAGAAPPVPAPELLPSALSPSHPRFPPKSRRAGDGGAASTAPPCRGSAPSSPLRARCPSGRRARAASRDLGGTLSPGGAHTTRLRFWQGKKGVEAEAMAVPDRLEELENAGRFHGNKACFRPETAAENPSRAGVESSCFELGVNYDNLGL